jgi:molybdopterin molybdotransferase
VSGEASFRTGREVPKGYTPPMPELLSVDRALEIVLRATRVLPSVPVALEAAAGRILAETVRAGQDYPAFDKSLMDGYAVMASDLATVPRDLTVVQEIAAGADPASLRPLTPGAAARIMTGAPLPPSADAVLIVEQSEPAPTDPRRVRALASVRPGDNLARRGNDVRAGDLLLPAGEFIGAGEIGVLAACGRPSVQVGARPRVGVLATGDELVPPGEAPGPGRIRNSNGPVLVALAARAGAEVLDLGIAPDRESALGEAIEAGLQADLLVLSGGVSMGVYDLVGKVLRSLGVEILFDGVAIRPGKPFTFGRRGAAIVAGCPGNPVSSYVIFQVFLRPALRKMAGHPEPLRKPVRGRLATPLRQRPGRTGFHQARVRWDDDRLLVESLTTSGSADFASCARGNALAIVPAGVTSLAAGDAVDLMLLDDFDDR